MNNQGTRQHRRGVTLLEAILVVLILGAAAVATSFTLNGSSAGRRESRNSTLDVSRMLTQARNTAMQQRTTVRVSYSTVLGINQISVVEDPGPITAGRTWSTMLSPNVKVAGKPNEIQFKADGSANSSLSWSIAADQSVGQIAVAPVGGVIEHQVP